jgi:hypothetical protein
MAFEELSKTAIQVSGWAWTIFEHILALFYITLFVWLASKWLKFKHTDIKFAIYIAIISTIFSFVAEVFLPIQIAMLTLIIMFFLFVLLIHIFYKQDWKNSFLASLIICGLIIGVNIILGIVHGIFVLLVK